MVLAENELFKLCGDAEYLNYAEEFLRKLTIKSKKIRSFFKVLDHSKITINLFKTKEDLHQYVEWKYGEKSESYSHGGFNCHEIFIYADLNTLAHQMFLIVDAVMHEYSHIVYSKVYEGKFSRVLWLDEGLAQHLSEEKNLLDYNYDRFKSFFLRRVVAKGKDIPSIDNLKCHGTCRGQFGYSRYDGYAISYMIVRFIFDKVRVGFRNSMSAEEFREKEQNGMLKQMIGDEVYNIVSNYESIKELEEHGVLGKMINYYGAKFKIRPSAININRITRPEELMDYMDVCMTYGWIDKFGHKHRDELKNFKALYKTNSLEQIMSSNLGTCIEQAKLQKYVFDHLGLNCKLYVDRRYERADEKKDIKMHCLTVYENDGKWYYFEHCNNPVRGIKSYDSLDDFLEDYKSKMASDRILTEIPEILDGLSYAEFNQYINHIDNLESERGRTIL